MAFARLYDIAKQYGLVQTNASTVGSITSAPFARRRSIALFGPRPSSVAEPPSGSIWSTALPHILSLTQRIQALETDLGQVNSTSDDEREDLQTRLFEATRTIEDLTDRLKELEDKNCQDVERLGSEILEVQLKYDVLKLVGEDVRRIKNDFAEQMEEFRDASKQLQVQIAGRDSMISKLLFDVASLFKDNELLAKKGSALEAQLLDAQQSIKEKDAALIEMQNTMPDPQKLGAELARLQNGQLDSCIFKREEDSEDSIIIITEDQSEVRAGDKFKPTNECSKLTGDITPSPSGAKLDIPVFTGPRPSLPPKKAKLKPLLLASRFTTSASSRRLLGRKRSAVSLQAPENKTFKALNPRAAEFKPRLVVPVDIKTEVVPLLLNKRLPSVEMTPRTTRATSVRLIKSRAVSRTSKMKSSRSKQGLTSSTSRASVKGAFTPSASRSALGEVTNLNM